jgi:hypothetical protein
MATAVQSASSLHGQNKQWFIRSSGAFVMRPKSSGIYAYNAGNSLLLGSSIFASAERAFGEEKRRRTLLKDEWWRLANLERFKSNPLQRNLILPH